jgi:hypothetical protein
MADEENPANNRAKKVAGRAKRRRFVQGTRAYTHAMTNSMARRAAEKGKERSEDEGKR